MPNFADALPKIEVPLVIRFTAEEVLAKHGFCAAITRADGEPSPG
jgi:hypothetical protein